MLARMYDLKVMREEMAQGLLYDCLWTNDALVAFTSYGPVSRDEMKLYKLYVDPACQRRGCGTQLLRHIEDNCRTRGFNTLCLTVNKRNEKAIAAYRKNGFTVRESIVVDIGGSFVMDDYVMAKLL